MKVVTLSVTEPGRSLARSLPFEHIHGSPADSLRSRWNEVDGFVVMLAVGATVRLVAPLLVDKARDPAVVCVDDAGRFAVVLCGGHQGGANQLATQVATILGCQPVITTATDRLGLPALDMLPGFHAEGDIAGVTAALLANRSVTLKNELGWPVPHALEAVLQGQASQEEPSSMAPTVVITDRSLERVVEERANSQVVVLHPPSLVLGVGSSSDATSDDSWLVLNQVLEGAGLSSSSLSAVATVERRRHHPAIAELVDRLGVPSVAFPSQALNAVSVPTPSEQVKKAVGTASVAEASALLGGGTGASLAVTKTISPRVTLAISRRLRPRGSLSVVSLGPGSSEHRTAAAERAVRNAGTVIGYSGYIHQCADLLSPAQRVLDFPLGAELERARRALELAASGNDVAVVCSGDAGVYAMASPILEMADLVGEEGGLLFPDVHVRVIPGTTAGSAAASLLGAPLGHDHMVISLSDLHTPWPHIEKRVTAAAMADLVVVLYNPRSQRRTWQIEKAKGILLEHRSPSTPVGVVANAARPSEQVTISTLGDLVCEEVTMTTCVIVGSSTTRVINGRMVTPRGYQL